MNNLENKIASYNNTDPFYYASLLQLQDFYKTEVEGVMKNLTQCNHVYEVIPKIQEKICTKGDKWISLIQLYLLLIVSVIILAITFKRLSQLVQKKINEQKVIFQNFYIIQKSFFMLIYI